MTCWASTRWRALFYHGECVLEKNCPSLAVPRVGAAVSAPELVQLLVFVAAPWASLLFDLHPNLEAKQPSIESEESRFFITGQTL